MTAPFGIRESKSCFILTRDGIGISHFKLNGSREEVQKLADALNAALTPKEA